MVEGARVEPLDEVLEVLGSAFGEADDAGRSFREARMGGGSSRSGGVSRVEGGGEKARGGAESFAVDEEGFLGRGWADVDGGDGGEEVSERESRVERCEGPALGG